MSGEEHQVLKLAQSIRSRKWVLCLLTILIALAGFLLPRYQPYFFSFEHGHSDLRTRLLSPGLSEQYQDVVFVKITEAALEEMIYRSPIDRAWLAGLVDAVDEQQPKVIAIDVLFDQDTEPKKDALLLNSFKTAQSSIVLAKVDSRTKSTPKQKNYLETFLKESGASSGFVNISADEDDIVRGLPVSVNPEHPDSFPDVVAQLATGTLPPKPKFGERISWLKSIDSKYSPFPEMAASFVKQFPEKIDLKGKVVLIGADLPGTDKHKTPFADQGRVKKGTSGARILTQIIAQRLDNRRVVMLPGPLEFLLYMIAALSGFLIAASSRVFSQKAKILSALGILALLVDMFFFKFFSVLIPTAMILFTLGLAVGLPAFYIKLKGWMAFILRKKGAQL